MPSDESIALARRALSIYDEKLRSQLEESNPDDFVAIEPESGEFFVGPTMSEAIQAARAAYPDRLPFTLRVGHRATVQMGVLSP
jgi:hypothetical protein